MRIQSINSSNYVGQPSNTRTNKNPEFKADVCSVIKTVFTEADLKPDSPYVLGLREALKTTAIEHGLIEDGNIGDFYIKLVAGNCYRLILFDKTTPIGKKIASITDSKLFNICIEGTVDDKKTEKVLLAIGNNYVPDTMNKLSRSSLPN